MLQKVFKQKKILVGMIHLPPLLLFHNFPGIEKCIDNALEDLETLQKAGFDGALIENEHDKPHTEFANPAQISSFTAIALEVCKKAKIPVGVQMMLNDWKSSFAMAKVVGAKFTRLDVFVDQVTSEWGEINPNPDQIIRYKKEIYPKLILLTDIQVKHKKMLMKKPLIESARQAIAKGTNAIVVTGEKTGEETPLENIKKIKKVFPNFPVWIGAGLNSANISEQMFFADGAIVGTSIKTGERIDFTKAKQLVMALRG